MISLNEPQGSVKGKIEFPLYLYLGYKTDIHTDIHTDIQLCMSNNVKFGIGSVLI